MKILAWCIVALTAIGGVATIIALWPFVLFAAAITGVVAAVIWAFEKVGLM